MEIFNEQYQNQRDSESIWIETLKKFNTENTDCRTFTDKVSVGIKEQFTYNLIHYLKDNVGNETTPTSTSTMVQVLTSLRISLREITDKDREIVKNELYIFFKLGNVGESEKIKMNDDLVREESLKCIVNCIGRDPIIQNTFQKDLNGPILLVKEVRAHGEQMSIGVLDIIYKILVHCCAKPDIKQQLKPEGILEHVTEQLVKKVSNPQTFNAENAPLLSDLCRLLFTLTIHLGPLEGGKPTPATNLELNGFRALLPIFKKIITHYTPSNNNTDPMYTLKCALISSLINTPRDLYDELIEEIPLIYFQDLFKSQIHLLSTPETASEFLPILMLLTNTAENVISTRQQLKEMTFPYDLIKETDEPLSVSIEPPEEVKKTGISSKLIPFMTGSDIGLKHFVSEYFFMICDEDANEVCRLTGFGNAAGLLVTRGLLSIGGKP